jgi:amino acid permease
MTCNSKQGAPSRSLNLLSYCTDFQPYESIIIIIIIIIIIRVQKTEITAVGIGCADHATPSIS